MKLNVLDRLILLSILPQEGDVTTLRVLRDLKSRLSFTEEEHAALEFKSENGGTIWKRDADVEVEISFGAKALRMVVEAFEKLDKEKTLKIEFLPTYDKFIQGE